MAGHKSKKIRKEELIMLQNEITFVKKLAQLIKENRQKWVRCTLEQWQQLLPWPNKKIQKIIKGLHKKGVIKIEYHNPDPFDRSRWFSINYTELKKNVKSDYEFFAKLENYRDNIAEEKQKAQELYIRVERTIRELGYEVLYRQETTERLIWLLIRKKATDEEIIKSVVRMLMIIAKGGKIEKPFLYIRKVLDSIKKESKGLETYKELISMLEKETGANRRIIKEAIKRFEQQNSVAETEHTTADTKENKQVIVIYERFKKLLEVVTEEEPNINYRTILNIIRDLLRKGMQQGDIILTLLKMIEDIKKKIKPNKHYPNIIPNVFSYLVKIIRNIQAIRNKKLPEQLKRIRKVLKATKEQAREALNMHIEAIIKGKKIINHERYYFKKLKDIVTKDIVLKNQPI